MNRTSLRILHVLPPAAGGMLRHVRHLMLDLDERRHEGWCAAAPGAGLESLAALRPDRCLPLRLRDGDGPLAMLRAAVALRSQIGRARPDLLHGHGYRGMLVAAVAARLSGRPFVFTAHNLPGELGPRFWRLARPLCRRARAAVCVSGAVAKELEARLADKPGGAARFPLHVVYNGIAPGPAPGARRPLPAELRPATSAGAGAPCRTWPVLVTAARLAPQKGVGVLVDAWARLAPRYPDGLLLVAGDGPLRAELQARAKARGVAGAVCFAGFREDVRALLEAADAAVAPSLSEGQSMFALEAMAAGAPVVASRAGGLPEMVRDGETGLLTSPGDAPALAEALARLFEDPALAARLAVEARAFVEGKMTLERMLAAMGRFYEGLRGELQGS